VKRNTFPKFPCWTVKNYWQVCKVIDFERDLRSYYLSAMFRDFFFISEQLFFLFR